MHISKLFSYIYEPFLKSIHKTNPYINVTHAYTNINFFFEELVTSLAPSYNDQTLWEWRANMFLSSSTFCSMMSTFLTSLSSLLLTCGGFPTIGHFPWLVIITQNDDSCGTILVDWEVLLIVRLSNKNSSAMPWCRNKSVTLRHVL